MMLSTASLRRLSDRIGPQLLRNCASAPDSVDLPYYMTTAADPINHTKKYLGRMYKLPKELLERFPEPTGGWSDKFLPRDFMRHGDLFGEHCLLIRRPALEVTHYLRQLDAKAEEGQGQADPVRFVLHGKYGNGKTTSLIHIHHYLINNPKVIVLNFGDFGLWSKRYRQVCTVLKVFRKKEQKQNHFYFVIYRWQSRCTKQAGTTTSSTLSSC